MLKANHGVDSKIFAHKHEHDTRNTFESEFTSDGNDIEGKDKEDSFVKLILIPTVAIRCNSAF